MQSDLDNGISSRPTSIMHSNATGYRYNKISLIYRICNINMVDNNEASKAERALIFQGGGSLRAYEAGAYKAINDELSAFIGWRQGREKKELILFHIISGISIGAINAAVLVSYVKAKEFLRYSDQKYQSQTVDFLIHRIHGIFMTTNH